MLTLEMLMSRLWEDYSTMNKQAGMIHRALEARGESVVNDHVAFRTFDDPKVGIDAMAAPFLKLGYKDSGNIYNFPEKKLIARHYEHSSPGQPKIFISALKTEDCSPAVRKTVKTLLAQAPETIAGSADFLVSGTPWKKVSWQAYQDLLKESEYAAWMAAFGFRVNHFTVSFNHLKTFKDFQELNAFIKGLGFKLNDSGGEVKGSKEVFLEQSSTLAHPVAVEFADKKETIPACYYEFARRYAMPGGKIFQGFLPDSANKIFESTDYKKKSSR
jgi:hypothetical protein